MVELDLRVKGETKMDALLALREHLVKECGVLFQILKTLRHLEEESPGVWRCKVVVGSYLPEEAPPSA